MTDHLNRPLITNPILKLIINDELDDEWTKLPLGPYEPMFGRILPYDILCRSMERRYKDEAGNVVTVVGKIAVSLNGHLSFIIKSPTLEGDDPIKDSFCWIKAVWTDDNLEFLRSLADEGFGINLNFQSMSAEIEYDHLGIFDEEQLNSMNLKYQMLDNPFPMKED